MSEVGHMAHRQSNVAHPVQELQCVDKEQFKIKLLQKICNVKWTFKQKQIHRQNETFNLLSANKLSVEPV